ncbi:hypothetical protein PoB_002950600 [Plakobranchus ocellatus]|uniref:Uncharacterized protein n=1 Tax=Plakobranchus ocellatus TaxID=259542 RepID=A0AAV4A8J2_9GAST|nr:hypothetical protein PoB_002950600 [Plakobranchus ocellatus]
MEHLSQENLAKSREVQNSAVNHSQMLFLRCTFGMLRRKKLYDCQVTLFPAFLRILELLAADAANRTGTLNQSRPNKDQERHFED